MNAVHLIGTIGQYGVKISYTENAKPQTSFTMIVEEPGSTGTFKTFIPVLIVGNRAEEMAETIEAGEIVALSGKLAYQKGKTKDSGKLVVVCYGVERLAVPIPARAVESAN